MHLNLNDAISRTSLTPAPLDVETKAAFFVASNLGFIGLGKEIANVVKYTCIGSWIGAWSAANRTLVDINQSINVLDT